jgi:hypothetical protein
MEVAGRVLKASVEVAGWVLKASVEVAGRAVGSFVEVAGRAVGPPPPRPHPSSPVQVAISRVVASLCLGRR